MFCGVHGAELYAKRSITRLCSGCTHLVRACKSQRELGSASISNFRSWCRARRQRGKKVIEAEGVVIPLESERGLV